MPRLIAYANAESDSALESAKEALKRHAAALADQYSEGLIYTDRVDRRLANKDRPGWQRMGRDLRRGDHLLLLTLADNWARDLTVLRLFNQLLDRGISIRLVEPPMLLHPGTPMGEFFRLIRALREHPLDDETAAENKARARKRGRPVNQYCSPGWKWARDRQGNAYKVPDRKARQMMQAIIHLRDELGWTWDDVTEELRRRRFRSAHHRPPHKMTCQRLYKAAKADPTLLEIPEPHAVAS